MSSSNFHSSGVNSINCFSSIFSNEKIITQKPNKSTTTKYWADWWGRNPKKVYLTIVDCKRVWTKEKISKYFLSRWLVKEGIAFNIIEWEKKHERVSINTIDLSGNRVDKSIKMASIK